MEYATGAASLFAGHAREPKQPDFVLAPLLSTFNGTTVEVIAIMFGENGYRKTDWGHQTREWIIEQNKATGIDAQMMTAFQTCSMTGNWANYEKVLASVRAAFEELLKASNE